MENFIMLQFSIVQALQIPETKGTSEKFNTIIASISHMKLVTFTDKFVKFLLSTNHSITVVDLSRSSANNLKTLTPNENTNQKNPIIRNALCE